MTSHAVSTGSFVTASVVDGSGVALPAAHASDIIFGVTKGGTVPVSSEFTVSGSDITFNVAGTFKVSATLTSAAKKDNAFWGTFPPNALNPSADIVVS